MNTGLACMAIVLMFGSGLGAAQELEFPDSEEATPAELAASLPVFVARVWASGDLTKVLSVGSHYDDDISSALGVWQEIRLPVDPKAVSQLARVADILVPLSERTKISNPSNPSYSQRSYAYAWWHCATQDWFTAGSASRLSSGEIDAMVLGQLDGSAPIRLHPENEDLLALAEGTSDAAIPAVRSFVSNAQGWLKSQLFNDLILALWRRHPNARPASGEAWGDLYLVGPAEHLLVIRAMGEVYNDRRDPVFVGFLRTGMNRFPDRIANLVFGTLSGGTVELPAIIGPDEACAWLGQMGRNPKWNPMNTIEALHCWVLRGTVRVYNEEPGDPLAIGRLAGTIRTMYQDAQQALKPKGVTIDLQPEFDRRIDAYEKLWRKKGK